LTNKYQAMTTYPGNKSMSTNVRWLSNEACNLSLNAHDIILSPASKVYQFYLGSGICYIWALSPYIAF